MREALRRHLRRRWRVWAIVGALVAVLAVDYAVYPAAAPMGGVSGDRGKNGLWLRYTWYFGAWQAADLERLARHAREGHVRDLYCHVRHAEPDGRLHYRKEAEAKRLTAALHAAMPDARVFAWIYVNGPRHDAQTDLSDPAARAALVGEAVWLVKTCGFDGIQWDYEVCPTGDAGHLALLRDTRAALPGVPLSTCAPAWYRAPITRWYGWDEAYFAQVAAACDQVCVMAYDSGMYLPRTYVGFMRSQNRRVSAAVARGNPACETIIGLPTYEAGGAWGHHPHAENLRMALKGIRESSGCTGVALFADYTTDDAEWALYRRWWVGE